MKLFFIIICCLSLLICSDLSVAAIEALPACSLYCIVSKTVSSCSLGDYDCTCREAQSNLSSFKYIFGCVQASCDASDISKFLEASNAICKNVIGVEPFQISGENELILAGTSKSTYPFIPTDPAIPAEPTDPAIPAEPTDPDIPAEPTDPDIPAEPTDPDIPARPK
ncbi:unnamed protein product [Adineta ricciae]|uniref:CFEM domain-containing protein n=1 Tax=Adineta ricciae TaxID=249248 RepID=A0A815URN2_ADIRI|nr:unnamed protein product [Adineta ricciae]CAF1655795.1 unnamed protein product [Adineta ricciae]